MSLKIFLIFAVSSIFAQDIAPPDFSQISSSKPMIIPPIVTCPDNYHLTSQGCVLNQSPCSLPSNCSPQAVNCFQKCIATESNCGYNYNCNNQQTNFCSQQCQNQGFQSCNYAANCQQPRCLPPFNCPPPSCLPPTPCFEITTNKPTGRTTPSHPTDSITSTRRSDPDDTTHTQNPWVPSTVTSTTPRYFTPTYPGTSVTPGTTESTRCRGRKCRKRKFFNYNIIFPAVNNTIVNVNNITNPVYYNNHNHNNFYVYSSIECADGTIRTMIVKNNETITECTGVTELIKDSTTTRPLRPTRPITTISPDDDYRTTPKCQDESCEITTKPGEKQCCEIYTPRRCEKKNGEWICGHRRYNYCLSFCGTRSKVYLQPRKPIYQGYILVVPALQTSNHNYCYGHHCNPPVDCSGCIKSPNSDNCSAYCSSYACQSSNECEYFDEEDFCEIVGGLACKR